MKPTETWVLPRPRKHKYPGGFPLHFEKKLWRLLGEPEKVLHPFGGMAEIGDKVDLSPIYMDEICPTIIGDAHTLPIKDGVYDLVILDPPYDDEQAQKIYETPKLKYTQYVNEAVRVCKLGGLIAVYHWVMTPRPSYTELVQRVVILTRTWHRPRVCQIFRKRLEL